MSKNGSKLDLKLSRGRPRSTHGGYSFLVKGVVPERRKYLLSYLSAARENIIQDYGGEQKMSASQIIILDRAIGKLGVLRCMEEHSKEYGIMFDSDLLPCLKKSYLAYANSLRRDLESLKELASDQIEPVLAIQDIIKEYDRKKEEKCKKSVS